MDGDRSRTPDPRLDGHRRDLAAREPVPPATGPTVSTAAILAVLAATAVVVVGVVVATNRATTAAAVRRIDALLGRPTPTLDADIDLAQLPLLYVQRYAPGHRREVDLAGTPGPSGRPMVTGRVENLVPRKTSDNGYLALAEVPRRWPAVVVSRQAVAPQARGLGPRLRLGIDTVDGLVDLHCRDERFVRRLLTPEVQRWMLEAPVPTYLELGHGVALLVLAVTPRTAPEQAGALLDRFLELADHAIGSGDDGATGP